MLTGIQLFQLGSWKQLQVIFRFPASNDRAWRCSHSFKRSLKILASKYIYIYTHCVHITTPGRSLEARAGCGFACKEAVIVLVLTCPVLRSEHEHGTTEHTLESSNSEKKIKRRRTQLRRTKKLCNVEQFSVIGSEGFDRGSNSNR